MGPPRGRGDAIRSYTLHAFKFIHSFKNNPRLTIMPSHSPPFPLITFFVRRRKIPSLSSYAPVTTLCPCAATPIAKKKLRRGRKRKFENRNQKKELIFRRRILGKIFRVFFFHFSNLNAPKKREVSQKKRIIKITNSRAPTNIDPSFLSFAPKTKKSLAQEVRQKSDISEHRSKG